MNEETPRGNLYLLTGLIIGLVIGVLISVVFFPARYESDPSALSETHRNEYRRLIAEAYQADGNLPRASDRLRLLHDEDAVRVLAAQAQRILAEGGEPGDARPLAMLAAALNQTASTQLDVTPSTSQTPFSPEATLDETQAGAEPTQAETVDLGEAVRTPTPVLPSATPRPTFTPRPSATPPRVLDAPFSLVSKDEVCDGSLPPGTLAVEVRDDQGVPLAGVQIQVSWDGGQESFYTGLVPEVSLGYADFSMQSGVAYSLRVGQAGDLVSDLSIPACGGSYKIIFQEGAR